jgi:hypothetical protein
LAACEVKACEMSDLPVLQRHYNINAPDERKIDVVGGLRATLMSLFAGLELALAAHFVK